MTDASGEGAGEPCVDPDTGGVCTPLFDLHTELGGRMVNFGGHALPMRYGDGTVAEHRATRTAAGLFDVSHMGIVELHPTGTDGTARVAAWLERCVPGSIVNLAPGRMRYTLFTTAGGGVLDDLIVTNLGHCLRIVVNAVRTDADLDMLRAANEGSDSGTDSGRNDDGGGGGFAGTVHIKVRADLALVALQGPAAAEVLARWAAPAAELAFMYTATLPIDGVDCEVSRCGYTGEDGFEIAMPVAEAVHIARLLLSAEEVSPAGLGARDTLRLEAGLPLVGHELTEATTPAEAGLGWSIPKRRRADGGYPGAELIATQLSDGPPRLRVGIAAEGRRPIRDGAVLRAPNGTDIGMITSGGYGPTVDAPIAMAYVAAEHAAAGTELLAEGRKGAEPCQVAPLPFVEHRYWRPS
ncbi:glycine cleavage system aminomethyltransferase GcvT [Candidatus Poriferisodalis sp.]|uniref:glycine cleavage system aminomethyltransferase GcvT n=1 Tax=Candidatus Poriferisodalis sp. TaxID=3101277 RepID=UPI003B01FB5F